MELIICKVLQELNINLERDGLWEQEEKIRKYLANPRLDVVKGWRINSGASKLVLIIPNCPYVIKWDYDNGDSAWQEVELYEQACEKGIGFLFPKTEIFCKINGVMFIKQEKVDCSAYHLSRTKAKKYERITKTVKNDIQPKMQKQFNKACSNYVRSIDELWTKMVCSLYGRKVCIALCEFIIEHKINDLHSHNIGYLHNKPILIDFCGYDNNQGIDKTLKMWYTCFTRGR